MDPCGIKPNRHFIRLKVQILIWCTLLVTLDHMQMMSYVNGSYFLSSRSSQEMNEQIQHKYTYYLLGIDAAPVVLKEYSSKTLFLMMGL